MAEVPAEAGDRTVRIDRYINNQLSDTAVARRIEVNVKTKVALLKEKVKQPMIAELAVSNTLPSTT